MFTAVKAKFQDNIPDDIIALFFSEGGELVNDVIYDSIDIYFTEPRLAFLSGVEYEKCLCWWYISDCYHCGKRLKEDHYRPVVAAPTDNMREQKENTNLNCEMMTKSTFLVQGSCKDVGPNDQKPEISLVEKVENDYKEQIQTNDHRLVTPILLRQEIIANPVKKHIEHQVFYLHPSDEGCSLLKSKLQSLDILVIDELSSESTPNKDLIIISYKLHPYLSNYSRIYTPFCLARMLDQEENKTRGFLRMPQTEFYILDKPCPIEPIRPQLEISISGFVGQQRTVVQLMVQLTGSRYNDHLSPAVDILIVPIESGNNDVLLKSTKKSEAARAWKIPIVDLSWLEKSLQTWNWAFK
jgi:hypothetical protein